MDKDLAKFIKDKKSLPLDPKLVESIMKNSISGLYYLQRIFGFDHRDIKLENLLMKGEVSKLCDFNVSKKTMGHTLMASAIVGTFEFLAPELRELNDRIGPIIGEQINWGKADMFSLGIVALCMMNPKQCIGNILLNKSKLEASKIIADISKSKVYEEWMCSLIEKMIIWDYRSRIDKAQAFEDVYQHMKEIIQQKKEREDSLEKEIKKLEDNIKHLKEEKSNVHQEISTLLSELEQVYIKNLYY